MILYRINYVKDVAYSQMENAAQHIEQSFVDFWRMGGKGGDMAHDDWLTVFKDLVSSGGKSITNACPECGAASVNFQYVGDTKTRVGYLRIWCSSCWKGVHLSRVRIPETAQMLSFDAPKEELDRKEPRFEVLEP